MASDKTIPELPGQLPQLSDLLVGDNGIVTYKFTEAQLIALLQANLSVGAVITFASTAIPSNTIGNDGDVFWKQDTGQIAQKLSGTWTVVYTIVQGVVGSTIYYGSAAPTTQGINGDTYLQTVGGNFYTKIAGTWTLEFSMATGPVGPVGPAGTNGTNGTDGNTILFGTTNPSNSTTGVNGNFYINTNTYTLFGPKASGDWGSGISFIGAGIPAGGAAGQILAKADGTDFNTDWEDNSFANLSGQPGDNASMAAALGAKQDALGFTPENNANKGQPNGYPSLDSAGRVPSSQLPSYVDEVQEFANLASFPTTGAGNIIYIAIDTNYEYRWSGSLYVQLVASPGSTDAVPEGTTNLYYTAARVLAAVLAGITFGTVSAITATDSILTAFGKLQAQISSITGSALPSGGTTGQVLSKNSNTNYDTGWINPPSGGSSGFSYNFYQSTL